MKEMNISKEMNDLNVPSLKEMKETNILKEMNDTAAASNSKEMKETISFNAWDSAQRLPG